LISDRLCLWGDTTGRRRDRGFGFHLRTVSVTEPMVADSIVWAKLRALSDDWRVRSYGAGNSASLEFVTQTHPAHAYIGAAPRKARWNLRA
jgi:hypothetical protein